MDPLRAPTVGGSFLPNPQTDTSFGNHPPPHPSMPVNPYNTLTPPGFDVDSPPPFKDATFQHGPTNYGVVIIRNIPYSVSKAEIHHFLGRHAPLIAPNTQGVPIHIIMERSTAKTMDCFAELLSVGDAQQLVHRHENAVQSGRHPRLGVRHIIVELSSQDELLSQMFLRAKSLKWFGGIPLVLSKTDPYSSGFTGFFTKEEMVGLVRHAEVPQRSPFSAKCLQRTYECMISTLYKFPWFMPHLYTLEARNMLFSTYLSQLTVLVDKVAAAETVGLDNKLLMEFLFAGMNCPGFGERNKAEIVRIAGRWGNGIPLSPVSAAWPFDVVTRRMEGPGEWDNIVRFYLHLLELGVQVYLTVHVSRGNTPTTSPFPFEEFISFRVASDVAPDPNMINNTRFCFTEESGKLTFDTAMHMELGLMAQLLEAGWDKWQYQHGLQGLRINVQPDHGVRVNWTARAEEYAASYAQNKSHWQQKSKPTAGTIAHHRPMSVAAAPEETPPVSPKGTVSRAVEDESENDNMLTPRQPIPNQAGSRSAIGGSRHMTGIDPAATPFQPRPRMNSAPTMFQPLNFSATDRSFGEPRTASDPVAMMGGGASGQAEDFYTHLHEPTPLNNIPTYEAQSTVARQPDSRRSAALPIKRPDVSLSSIAPGRSTIPSKALVGLTFGELNTLADTHTSINPPVTFGRSISPVKSASPSGSVSPERGLWSGRRSERRSSVTVGTPSRGLVNIGTTIQEESEPESGGGQQGSLAAAGVALPDCSGDDGHEAEKGVADQEQDEDEDEEEIVMNTGRRGRADSRGDGLGGNLN